MAFATSSSSTLVLIGGEAIKPFTRPVTAAQSKARYAPACFLMSKALERTMSISTSTAPSSNDLSCVDPLAGPENMFTTHGVVMSLFLTLRDTGTALRYFQPALSLKSTSSAIAPFIEAGNEQKGESSASRAFS